MKIKTIEAFAVKIPRDAATARGTAGSPAPLVRSLNDYRWATNYQTIYSTRIETALIKVTTDKRPDRVGRGAITCRARGRPHNHSNNSCAATGRRRPAGA